MATTSSINSIKPSNAVLSDSMSQPRSPASHRSSVDPFGDGFKVTLVTPNLCVELLTLGAAINSVKVRNPHKSEGGEGNEWVEVVLGYKDANECAQAGAPIGATIGRFAGCIEKGEFDLNGSNYKLLQNYSGHTLHGGPKGFDKQQWKYLLTDGEDELGVSFHLISPHLDQGFPGELFVTVTYTIEKMAPTPTLKWVHQAVLADSTPVAATVVNLSNRTHWNLNGVRQASRADERCILPEPITNHYVQVHSKYAAAAPDGVIPDGTMLPTEGTEHDYTTLRCIQAGMKATTGQDRELGGYDDLLALDVWDSTLREAAVVYSPITNLQMRVLTTAPAIVVSTASRLPMDADGTKGRRFQTHAAMCLATQYFSNSPNVESFPSTVLAKGETYSETTVHEFKFLNARLNLH